MIMVTIVKYLLDSTGIDLSLTAEEQKISLVDTTLARQSRSIRERPSAPAALEALYDAVVGVDRVQGRGFCRDSNLPARLGPDELDHLVDIAEKLEGQYSASTEQKSVLKNVAQMAFRYRALLSGELGGVSRRRGRFGARHTLIRAKNGTVFEMTNSMQEAEIERFRRKTNMRISAVEGSKPAPESPNAALKGRKIGLGKGAFGTVRIARDIFNDQYVAVKKTHAVLVSQGTTIEIDHAVPSNYSMLPEPRKELLRSVSDAVILPVSEVKALSKASVRIAREANFPLKGADVIEAVKSIYTFSELGISAVENIYEGLNFAGAHFEGKTASSELSNAGLQVLADYAEQYGKTHTGSTAGLPNEIHRHNGKELFALPDFPLNDSQKILKFRNTLARETLYALCRLHGIEFTHNDIKPQNIVLTQSPDGTVSAKLIDIDVIRDKLKVQSLRGGTPFYRPPEASPRKISYFSPYDAEKGDGYAMGLSLRQISGHSRADTLLATQQQHAKAQLIDLEGEYARTRGPALMQRILELRSTLVHLSSRSATLVRNREEIGQAACLKDVSDLLMQVAPSDRITPRQAIDLEFFKNEDNFLSKKEFSDDARIIVRLCQFIPAD